MSILRSDFLNRIKQYCAEAEKSTHDVLEKLETWNVPPEEIDDILLKLRSEKFLNDTRYVKSYVSEKWLLDKWGKIKIRNSLQQKKTGENIINEALTSIHDEEYEQGLHELLQKKLREVKSDDKPSDARRLMMFAQSRGFEEELIMDWLEKNGLDN